MLRRILLIEGFPIEEKEFSVQWSSRAAYSVEDIDVAADTAVKLVQAGLWDVEQGLNYMGTYVMDMDRDAILERLNMETET